VFLFLILIHIISGPLVEAEACQVLADAGSTAFGDPVDVLARPVLARCGDGLVNAWSDEDQLVVLLGDYCTEELEVFCSPVVLVSGSTTRVVASLWGN